MNYNLLKGCLCWFWNTNEAEKKIGILADIYEDEETPITFYELNGGLFKYCEPAKYEDVVFYNENPMKSVYKKAKEKAARDIICAIDGYLNEVMDDYIGEMPNVIEGMRSNKEHVACAESEDVIKAIERYMELM